MTRNRLRALFVAAFPLMLAVGIVTIPIVSDYADHALAERAASQTARWFWGHVISGVGFGVGTLAACFIATYLSPAEPDLELVALPLMAVGAALYAVGLGADGIGPVAVVAGGGQARLFFDGSGMRVSSVFIAASVMFGAGLITQVLAVIRAGVLTGMWRVLALLAAIIFASAAAIPSGWGLYLIAAAALVIYVPISVAMWREPANNGGKEP